MAQRSRENSHRFSLVDLGLVAAYLCVAIAANVTVYVFGQKALPFTALILIPFELTSRDELHSRWHTHGRLGMSTRMFVLVCTGSALTMAVNMNATAVAFASAASFCIAGLIDTAVYELLFHHPKMVKINLSNVASSGADSVAFPIIAFGMAAYDWRLSVAQSMSKIIGGCVWSFIIVILFHGRSKR